MRSKKNWQLEINGGTRSAVDTTLESFNNVGRHFARGRGACGERTEGKRKGGVMENVIIVGICHD